MSDYTIRITVEAGSLADAIGKVIYPHGEPADYITSIEAGKEHA